VTRPLLLASAALCLLAAGASTVESPPEVEPPEVEPPKAAPPRVERVGRLEAEALNESSGLAASSRHPGVFWTHNDSGGAPVLYAMDARGTHLGAVRVSGATAKDWESIAARDGLLYVGDVGNNANRRKDLAVHVVPEPDVAADSVAVERTVRFRYPDQTEFPPAARNFDAEALFHDGDDLYLLTKHRGDTETTLYRFPRAPFETDARATVLTKLATFDVGGADAPFGGMVTAADLRGDGERLAVLTYHALFVFDRPEAPERWLEAPRLVLPLDPATAAQCEALAWDGDDLVFTNEGRGVFRVRAPGG